MVLACLFGFASCTEEVEIPTFGCTDPDSPRANLDVDFHDSTCVYMYAEELEVTYFENKTWDPNSPFAGEADVVLKLGDANMDSIYYNSLRINNADATQPHRWVVDNQFQLKNQIYSWELYNEAALPFIESDELMTSGTFNPLNFKNDSVIVIQDQNQTTQIKVRYVIK